MSKAEDIFREGVTVYRSTPDRMRDKVLAVAPDRTDLLGRIETLRETLDDLTDKEVCDFRHPWRTARHEILTEILNITDPMLRRTELEHGVAYRITARNMPRDAGRISGVWDTDKHGFLIPRFKGSWRLDVEYHVDDGGTVKPWRRWGNQPSEADRQTTTDLLKWLVQQTSHSADG